MFYKHRKISYFTHPKFHHKPGIFCLIFRSVIKTKIQVNDNEGYKRQKGFNQSQLSFTNKQCIQLNQKGGAFFFFFLLWGCRKIERKMKIDSHLVERKPQ